MVLANASDCDWVFRCVRVCVRGGSAGVALISISVLRSTFSNMFSSSGQYPFLFSIFDVRWALGRSCASSVLPSFEFFEKPKRLEYYFFGAHFFLLMDIEIHQERWSWPLLICLCSECADNCLNGCARSVLVRFFTEQNMTQDRVDRLCRQSIVFFFCCALGSECTEFRFSVRWNAVLSNSTYWYIFNYIFFSLDGYA